MPQSNKDRMKEITDSLEQGIRDVFESGKYETYLETMSRFHSYSMNNTMLIYMQKPDILGVGRNTAFNVFHMNIFPRLEIMKRNLVLKTSFIEWFNKYVEDTQNEKHSKTSSKK